MNNLIKIKIKINKQKNTKNLYKDKESLNNILKISDFKELLVISKKEPNIINFTKIKNKKELYFLSEEENVILEKTIESNKNGFFFNIKAINKNNQIFLIASNFIPKETLITIVPGKIYFKKNFNKANKFEVNKENKNNILNYFKTAKTDYDRIIVLHEKSIIKFMFNPDNSREPNMYLLKVVDKNDEIKLLVLTKRNIDKGDRLLLDLNLKFK